MAIHSDNSALPDSALQAHLQQLLGLHRELHGKLPENVLAEPVNDEVNGLLRIQPTLLAVEQLIVADA